MNKVYIISGVSGAGKTSAVKHLKKVVPLNKYDIRDFDERGVPDGGGQVWHDAETRYWLEVAKENAKHKKDTIISGFADPERFKKVYEPDTDIPAQLILLDVSGDSLRKRLAGRHSTPETLKEIERAAAIPLEKFIEANVNYAPELRRIFEKEGLVIIDTDGKSPEEVAGELMQIIEETI